MEMNTLASEIRFEDDRKRLGCTQLVTGTIQVFFVCYWQIISWKKLVHIAELALLKANTVLLGGCTWHFFCFLFPWSIVRCQEIYWKLTDKLLLQVTGYSSLPPKIACKWSYWDVQGIFLIGNCSTLCHYNKRPFSSCCLFSGICHDIYLKKTPQRNPQKPNTSNNKTKPWNLKLEFKMRGYAVDW